MYKNFKKKKKVDEQYISTESLYRLGTPAMPRVPQHASSTLSNEETERYAINYDYPSHLAYCANMESHLMDAHDDNASGENANTPRQPGKRKRPNHYAENALYSLPEQQHSKEWSSMPLLHQIYQGGVVALPRWSIGALRDSLVKVKQCNCQRGSCLKLYCECFSSGIACTNSLCDCIGCKNVDFTNTTTTGLGEARFDAIKALLEEDNDVFRVRDTWTLPSTTSSRPRHFHGWSRMSGDDGGNFLNENSTLPKPSTVCLKELHRPTPCNDEIDSPLHATPTASAQAACYAQRTACADGVHTSKVEYRDKPFAGTATKSINNHYWQDNKVNNACYQKTIHNLEVEEAEGGLFSVNEAVCPCKDISVINNTHAMSIDPFIPPSSYAAPMRLRGASASVLAFGLAGRQVVIPRCDEAISFAKPRNSESSWISSAHDKKATIAAARSCGDFEWCHDSVSPPIKNTKEGIPLLLKKPVGQHADSSTAQTDNLIRKFPDVLGTQTAQHRNCVAENSDEIDGSDMMMNSCQAMSSLATEAKLGSYTAENRAECVQKDVKVDFEECARKVERTFLPEQCDNTLTRDHLNYLTSTVKELSSASLQVQEEFDLSENLLAQSHDCRGITRSRRSENVNKLFKPDLLCSEKLSAIGSYDSAKKDGDLLHLQQAGICSSLAVAIRCIALELSKRRRREIDKGKLRTPDHCLYRYNKEVLNSLNSNVDKS